MNKTSNVFLLTAALALVPLGVSTISADLIAGSVELVLGFVAVVVYSLIP